MHRPNEKAAKGFFPLPLFSVVLLFLSILQFPQTFGADIFALEIDNFLGFSAENAGRLVLFQDNRSAFHIDLNGVLLSDVQGAAQLNGKDDPTKLVHLDRKSVV